MGKVKKCKLSWKPSESDPNVEYRLYWSNAVPVGYNTNFVKLGKITEVDLPEILESHESLGESIYLGISAVDEWGNESDIVTLPEPYKLCAPAAPMDLTLTPLNYFKVTAPKEKAENHETGIQNQATESAGQEIQSDNPRPASKFITTEGKIVNGFGDGLKNTFVY